MKNKLTILLENPHKWWLLWGILSPMLILLHFFGALAILMYISNEVAYVSILGIVLELLPPALFGLWVIDNANFLENAKKFALLMALVIGLIFLFGLEFVGVSILLFLAALRLVKFSKKQFLWSFGAMLLYGILGLIPLFMLLWARGFDLQETMSHLLYNMLFSAALLFVGYAIKGTLFGIILHRYQRASNKSCHPHETSSGLVVQVKGNLEKIQTNDSQCSQRDYDGNCRNWINTPVEEWIKRSEVYPK